MTEHRTLKDMACPQCEYHKQRAQLWRHEAYKQGGYPFDWEPELVIRREWQGLTDEEVDTLSRTMVKGNKSVNWLSRAIEAALKEKNA